jgi:NADH-quinone oxidoreductase subunit J
MNIAIHPAAFWIFAGLALLAALSTVLKKNPVSSAFSLVLVFFAFAGIYASLGAHLVAALQVLVYAGAVMVLFVFVIMLLSSDAPSLDFGRTPAWAKALAGALALGLFWMTASVLRAAPATGVRGRLDEATVASLGGNTQVLSELLFSEYILPFELTSVLLLAGIVGAVATAKRHHKRKGAENDAARG